MGPKDKKGGGAKNKGQKNSELIRLLEDVSNLKSKLSDTNMQIKEEKQINDRLMAESIARTEHVQSIESKITKEEEKHEWHKQREEDAQQTVEEETYLRMKAIEEEEAELLKATAEHDFVATQNVTLHSWLKSIVAQYELDRQRREEEREIAMQTNFDIRMSMDQILRKTIRNFDNEYKQKAMVKMNDEAQLAKLDNARLFAEFARREETCSTLVKKQQASFEAMMRSKVELEVLETSTLLQEQLVTSLEQQCDNDVECLSRLRSDNEMLKQDILVLEGDNQDNSVHAAELHQLQDEIQQLEARLPLLRPNVLTFGAEIVEKAIASVEKHRKAAAESVASQASIFRDMQTCCDNDEDLPLALSQYPDGGLLSEEAMSAAALSFAFPSSPARSAAAGTSAAGMATRRFVDTGSLEAPLPPEILCADPTALWSSTVGNDAHLKNPLLRTTLRAQRMERQLQQQGDKIATTTTASGRRNNVRVRGKDNIVSLTSTSYSFY